MSKWKCTNCGNRIMATVAPSICIIKCCEQSGTYKIDSSGGNILREKWKCTNCGNKSSDNTPPTICPRTCCNETNSYVAV